MRNRAKCLLCQDVIESMWPGNFVRCSCKQIFVDGGKDYPRCGAFDWVNFVRIDDNDNEVPITVIEKEKPSGSVESKSVSEDELNEKVIDEVPLPSRNDLLFELDEMVKRYDKLPNHEKYRNVTETDLHYLALLLSAIFRAS